MNFRFEEMEIPGLILITPKVFEDNRGFFMESYKFSSFGGNGIKEKFVQENHSQSKKNVLRGLHYQKNPKAQGKLVRCIKGEILDVAVDIRRGSPYYGKWVGVRLSEENKKVFYIPPGFAHGFLTLSEVAEIIYKVTEEYSPEHDRGIVYNDPKININWPVKKPILSEKDKNLPTLEEADNNFIY